MRRRILCARPTFDAEFALLMRRKHRKNAWHAVCSALGASAFSISEGARATNQKEVHHERERPTVRHRGRR